MLQGRTVGDITSAAGDSLRIEPIVRFTSDGVLRRELYGDVVRSRELFESALLIDSMDEAANYQLALLLMDISPTEALPYAKRAMQGDTTNRWSAELYAQGLVMAGRYAEAKPIYRRLIARDERNADLYRILAILHQYTSQPYSAIMVLDSAELRIGRNPWLGRIKHNLLLSTAQHTRAVEEAREMVANMPYDVSSRLMLAEALASSGADSLAEVEYGIAAKIDPASSDLLMALSSFYQQRGRVEEYFDTLKSLFSSDEYSVGEATTLLGRITRDKSFYRTNYVAITELISILALRYPKDSGVVELRANHLIAFGMLDEALEIYKLYTRDIPPRLEYFLSVIEIEGYKKRLDSVTLYVNRAIELFPEDVELYLTKANARAYVEDFRGAKEVYMEAMRHASSDSLKSNIWGFIGDVEYQVSLKIEKASLQKKAMRRCFAAYNKALELYADNLMVLNNYAYFISEEPDGDFERALEMSSRVVELSQSNPVYLDTHAWVLYRLGRYAEAVPYIRTAISLDQSKSAELPLHYGDILAAQGSDFMAEVYWRRAEDLGYSKEEIQRRIESLKRGVQ